MEKERNYNICNGKGECGVAWQQGLFEVKIVRNRREQIQFQPCINKVLEDPDEIVNDPIIVRKTREIIEEEKRRWQVSNDLRAI